MMNASDDLAAEVRAILDDARRRTPPDDGRISVAPRSLSDALTAASSAGRRPVIAEVKPTSPTTDRTREADPVELATAMVDGGAAALSVLTEPEHFGGSADTLTRVRDAVDVPVLRKDFILDPKQLDVVEADVVLLIARFVDDLEELIEAARARGFQVLVETHTPQEVRTALEAGATIVGINNRDLARLEVDRSTFASVLEAATVPEDATLIAESGITTTETADRMLDAGADGLLIGSAIMDGADEGGPQRVRTNTERFTRR